MPELPEVEHFRRILLPLVDGGAVTLECPPPLPTKRFPSIDAIASINRGGYVATDVLRKGKVLCVVLVKRGGGSSSSKKSAKEVTADDDASSSPSITGDETLLYLSLHMGMTGRVSSPSHVPGLESLSGEDEYPPPHTHLIFKSSNGQQAAFSDPRRFGSVLVDVGTSESKVCHEERIPTFQDITVDALSASEAHCTNSKKASKGSTDDAAQQPSLVEQLANRKKGIKGLLLDQRAVVSGVGNWVADEVLYRSKIHPDQSYLDPTESQRLVEELYHVLSTAVTCLNDGIDFPDGWLFHRRWRNGGGGGASAKDADGKAITFIQSGGRSTAVVPSLQKNMGRTKLAAAASKKKSSGKKTKKGGDNEESKSKAQPKKKATAVAAATGSKPKAQQKKSLPKPDVKKLTEMKSEGTKGQKRKRPATKSKSTQPTRRSKRLAKS